MGVAISEDRPAVSFPDRKAGLDLRAERASMHAFKRGGFGDWIVSCSGSKREAYPTESRRYLSMRP